MQVTPAQTKGVAQAFARSRLLAWEGLRPLAPAILPGLCPLGCPCAASPEGTAGAGAPAPQAGRPAAEWTTGLGACSGQRGPCWRRGPWCGETWSWFLSQLQAGVSLGTWGLWSWSGKVPGGPWAGQRRWARRTDDYSRCGTGGGVDWGGALPASPTMAAECSPPEWRRAYSGLPGGRALALWPLCPGGNAWGGSAVRRGVQLPVTTSTQVAAGDPLPQLRSCLPGTHMPSPPPPHHHHPGRCAAQPFLAELLAHHVSGRTVGAAVLVVAEHGPQGPRGALVPKPALAAAASVTSQDKGRHLGRLGRGGAGHRAHHEGGWSVPSAGDQELGGDPGGPWGWAPPPQHPPGLGPTPAWPSSPAPASPRPADRQTLRSSESRGLPQTL